MIKRSMRQHDHSAVLFIIQRAPFRHSSVEKATCASEQTSKQSGDMTLITRTCVPVSVSVSFYRTGIQRFEELSSTDKEWTWRKTPGKELYGEPVPVKDFCHVKTQPAGTLTGRAERNPASADGGFLQLCSCQAQVVMINCSPTVSDSA